MHMSSLVLIKGKLVLVFKMNAPLRYKATWSESESRKFEWQWSMVSFFFKLNQFSREARLTYHLLRPKEDWNDGHGRDLEVKVCTEKEVPGNGTTILLHLYTQIPSEVAKYVCICQQKN